MKFIDEIRIYIKSGHGGPGCVSFFRGSKTPRGGPDGGDGGKGGDVIFKTSPHINSLVDYRANKMYAAANGVPGAASNMTGADGADQILYVPKGTVIKTVDGEVLADLTDVHEFVALKGGRGGKGNNFFKTSINQAPTHAQPGEDGEELEVFLELKLIADVGIIGFPNAGKSTLISAISAAKPKIADYPFTTLTPHLGVVKVDEGKSYVVADIPGLIKGAHLGQGLGTQFLRHIERTKFFIHLIDASGMSGRDPLADYDDINLELVEHDKINTEKAGFIPLSERPQITVLNKIEVLSQEDLQTLISRFQKHTGAAPLCISAVTRKGLIQLLNLVSQKVFAQIDSGENT